MLMKLQNPVLALSFLCAAAAAAAAPPYEHRTIPGASPEPIVDGAGIRSVEDLEAFCDGVMNAHLKYNPLAGAALAIVKDGAPILVKGYGYADWNKRTPVDGEKTLFRPGSTSKLFTWTAVMQLVEQGKLDLDADVNQYLRAFKLPDTFAEPITLRNLMTHTPGLEDGGLGYLLAKDADHLVSLEQTLMAHTPTRVRPPTRDYGADGRNVSYSNWGTALAGYIVAGVSGMPFEDYVDQHVFQPLQMTGSTFHEPLPERLAPHMATGHRFEKGRFEPHAFEFVHGFAPAGSMTASAADMAKFMIAQLNGGAYGGGRILKPETVQLMQSRQFSPNPYVNGAGLGFYESWINGRRTIGHGGDLVAFHADLTLLPEEKIGIFVAYNASNDAAPYIARRDLVKTFMDRYYPAHLPVVEPPKDFKERAARYAGSYRSNRGSSTKFEKVFHLFGGTKVMPTQDGTLLIQNILLPGLSYWVEVAPSVFREVDGDDVIAFVEDENGEVTHLVNSFPLIGSWKLPWWQTNAFHFAVLGFGVLCFIVAIVSAALKWKADRAGPGRARLARRLAALLGLVYVLFFVALGTGLAQGEDKLIFELPTALYVALAFPLIAIPITLGVVALAPLAWRDGWWTRYGRIQYTVIALASVAFLWSLHYWNMVGYRIG